METALKKDIYEQLTLVWSGSAGRETSEDCVVPDTMPDIGTVVDAEGVVTLRSKETETGYVQLAASVSVTVMYVPEEGGVMRSLEMTLPADIRMDAPAADPECRTVARMRVRSIDARAVNSRKLSVRAELEAEAQCYRRENREMAASLEDETAPAHLLTGSLEAMAISDVREKTFVVTDEYQLPPGCGAQSILSRRADAVVEDVKFVSGKVIFRGRVRTELVFSTGEEGSVFSGRYETEFSQIMEVDAESAETLPTVALALTGAYFDLPEYDQSSGRVSAELHYAAQCVCREKREMRYIADVYSNRTLLVPKVENICLECAARTVTMRQTVAGRAEPFTGEGEVLSVSACVGGVSVEEDGVKTSVNIRVISRRRDGEYTSARCRLSAEFAAAELPEGAKLQDITVTVTDAYCTGADVRATLQMDALAVTEQTAACVTELEEDAEGWLTQPQMPSATLIWVPEGADMWPIARQYHSTVEAIAAANDGRMGGLLLIPKGR